MEKLTPEEIKLVNAERRFQEEKGSNASISEMSEYSGMSKSKVTELRASIDRKGYAKQKKEGNKKIMLLFASVLGVTTAGIGAAAVIPSLKRVPKPTTPIIQPSGLPSQFAGQPYSQVVVVPERQILKETYIERGGRDYIQRDVSPGGYPSLSPYYQQQVQTQDKCLELGWEWKDGVCHPPDSGSSQVGIGDEFCQMQMNLLKTGDQTALANANYTYQVCGDIINPSEISNMIKAGCTILGQYFEESIMACDPNRNPDGTPKTTGREQYDAMKKLCRDTNGIWSISICNCGLNKKWDASLGCVDKAPVESLPDKCRRLGGNWTGFTCMCPDGKSGQTIDCTTHGGTETKVTEETEAWKCDNCPGLGQSDCLACAECNWYKSSILDPGSCRTKGDTWTPFVAPETEEAPEVTGLPRDHTNKSDCENAGYRWNVILGYCMA